MAATLPWAPDCRRHLEGRPILAPHSTRADQYSSALLGSYERLCSPAYCPAGQPAWAGQSSTRAAQLMSCRRSLKVRSGTGWGTAGSKA